MAGYEYARDSELDEAELKAIREVAREYYASWFTGDEDGMRRCLHPDLDKRGMVRRAIGDRELIVAPATSASQMVEMTRVGVGLREPGHRRADVTIMDATHHLASAKVTSDQFVEFLHLLKFRDGWRIVHAVWTFHGGVIANETTDL